MATALFVVCKVTSIRSTPLKYRSSLSVGEREGGGGVPQKLCCFQMTLASLGGDVRVVVTMLAWECRLRVARRGCL